MTVAHPFIEHPYDEFSDEEGSDMSEDDSDVNSIPINRPESAPSVMLDSDIVYVEDSLFHRERILCFIPEESRPKHFSRSTDWALLNFEKHRHCDQFHEIKGQTCGTMADIRIFSQTRALGSCGLCKANFHKGFAVSLSVVHSTRGIAGCLGHGSKAK